MVAKASLKQPFLSVASLSIVDSEGTKYNGSVFLIRTAKYERTDIVLGAGHNLTHLSEVGVHTQVNIYGNRDINMIAQRGNDSYRFGIAGTALPFDFGVAVLQEGIPKATPLLLTPPQDAAQIDVAVSGAVAAEVERGDHGIWFAATQITTHGNISYCDPGVTLPGMSGGPVVVKNDTDRAIGLIHGTGTIESGKGAVPKDLFVTMTPENIAAIDQLIARALSD